MCLIWTLIILFANTLGPILYFIIGRKDRENSLKLEIKNVTKSFKEKIAVNNFSMELQSGECVGLIGPNGAGKSTLIKVIADILNPNLQVKFY